MQIVSQAPPAITPPGPSLQADAGIRQTVEAIRGHPDAASEENQRNQPASIAANAAADTRTIHHFHWNTTPKKGWLALARAGVGAL